MTFLALLVFLVVALPAWGQINNLAVSSVTNNSATVTWQYAGIPPAAYTVPQKEEPGGTFCCAQNLSGSAATATIAGLKPGTTYTILVQARSAAGAQISSASVQATTAAAVMGNLTITWQDNSNNEDGFQLERSDNSGPFQSRTIGPNITQLVDTVVDPSTNTYCYRVRSYNSNGPSAYSNTGCNGSPAAPSILMVK